MTPLLRVVLCCAGLLSPFVAFAADNNMTPEERTIRLAYAKLIFAIEVQTVERNLHAAHRKSAAPSLANALQQNELRIELSGFKVGDIAEIADHDLQDVFPLPHGEDVLSIGGVSYSFEDADHKKTNENSASIPVWQPGPNVGKMDVHYTVAEVLAINQPTDFFDRYAAYNVVVTFQGKTRKYRALALLGRDAKGAPEVSFTDSVLEGGLVEVKSTNLYPAVLMESAEGQNHAVMDWLESKQMPLTDCTSGPRDICCDPATLKCGISSLDLKSASAYVAVRGQASSY